MLRYFRWTLLTIGLAALVTGLNLSLAQTDAEDYTEYEGRTLNRTETRRQLLNRPIMVKDVYDHTMSRAPRDVERMAPGRRFVWFRAQEGYGSGLIGIVNRENSDALETLRQAVQGDNILMFGRIRQAGTVFVFLVDEIHRGHERPVTRAITIKITDPRSERERSYRLSEPGRTYRIRSPRDDSELHISFSR